MIKKQILIYDYLEKQVAQVAWYEFATTTFDEFGDCQLVYYALLKVVELE
jgi:hypothetical protein